MDDEYSPDESMYDQISKENDDDKRTATQPEEENNEDSNNDSPIAVVGKDSSNVLNNRDYVFSKLGFGAEAEKFRNSHDSIIKLVEQP